MSSEVVTEEMAAMVRAEKLLRVRKTQVLHCAMTVRVAAGVILILDWHEIFDPAHGGQK